MSQNDETATQNLEELYTYGLTWLDALEKGLEERDAKIAALQGSLDARKSQLEQIRAALNSPEAQA